MKKEFCDFCDKDMTREFNYGRFGLRDTFAFGGVEFVQCSIFVRGIEEEYDLCRDCLSNAVFTLLRKMDDAHDADNTAVGS